MDYTIYCLQSHPLLSINLKTRKRSITKKKFQVPAVPNNAIATLYSTLCEGSSIPICNFHNQIQKHSELISSYNHPKGISRIYTSRKVCRWFASMWVCADFVSVYIVCSRGCSTDDWLERLHFCIDFRLSSRKQRWWWWWNSIAHWYIM